MWWGKNNSVRLDGMAGQFMVLFPDKDAFVVLTANARNTQEKQNLVHNYLIPAIKSDKALPANPVSYQTLLEKQSGMKIKPLVSEVQDSKFAGIVSGKEFVLQNNDYQIQSVYFAFKEGECSSGIKRTNQVSVIKAGSLFAWTDPNTLENTTRFIEESLGDQTIVCRFIEMNGVTSVTIGSKAMPGMAGAGAMRRMGPAPVQLRGNPCRHRLTGGKVI